MTRAGADFPPRALAPALVNLLRLDHLFNFAGAKNSRAAPAKLKPLKKSLFLRF